MKRKRLIAVVLVIFAILAAFMLAGCTNKSTEYDVVKRTKMDNFTFLNQSALHNQVVFIGDSIIELYPTYELFGGQDKVVYNRGISGDTSDRMLERLHDNCLNINPEVVYMLVGTNDIARGIEHSVILDNIGKSIDKCKEKGVAKVIVSGLYPVNKSINSGMVGARTNKEIGELNAKLSALCQQKGAIFVSFTDALADKNGNFNESFTYDGLHPNAKGYDAITKVIQPLIFS